MFSREYMIIVTAFLAGIIVTIFTEIFGA